MKVHQKQWTTEGGWKDVGAAGGQDAQLVFAFGGRVAVSEPARYEELRAAYPKARIVMSSTAGEILGNDVDDGTIAVSALTFEKGSVVAEQAVLEAAAKSKEVGAAVAAKLPKDGLVHALVFAEGLAVNGTDLVAGLLSSLPSGVSVTGGLVGDGGDFKKTVVGLDGVPQSGNVVVIGLYGDALTVGYGSLGGWDPFGPDRIITRSEGNVLYELDGKPALELYKSYLGDKAAELPASGLLFPIEIMNGAEADAPRLVRTLLAVDEKAGSMTFAGDMPQGAQARLMKANFDRLIDGAAGAGTMSISSQGSDAPQFALLVSCIGRKLVLKERISEEIEAVREKIGANVPVSGFYSYGEICPTAPTERQCQLHNQTMTITTIREA